MSTTSERLWLGVSVAGLALLITSLVLAVEVSHRHARCYVLSATPQAIGEGSSRIDYYLHNFAGSANIMVCGYNEALLSLTPGPDNGDLLSPGEGKHICIFADRPYYCKCVSGGSAIACLDESRMVTPTVTP